MKRSLKHILTCGFLLASCFSFSQNPKIDSLLYLLKISKNDSSKVDALNAAGNFYCYYFPPKVKFYANEALSIANTVKYQNGVAEAYLILGLVSIRMDVYSDANDYFKKALHIFEKTDNKIGLCNCYNKLSYTFSEIGNFELAMEYAITALKISEEINYKSGQGGAYKLLGEINKSFKHYSLALTYYKKSLSILLEIDDIQLGPILWGIGDIYVKIDKNIVALDYYMKSLDYSRKSYNRNSELWTLNRLGKYYFNQKEYSKAIEYFKSSLIISD